MNLFHLGGFFHTQNGKIVCGLSHLILDPNANWALDTDLKTLDLYGALGTLSTNGNTYSSSANLKLSRTEGNMLLANSNRIINPKRPNILDSDAEDHLQFLTAYGGSVIGVSINILLSAVTVVNEGGAATTTFKNMIKHTKIKNVFVF